jgi:hypothetical protein
MRHGGREIDGVGDNLVVVRVEHEPVPGAVVQQGCELLMQSPFRGRPVSSASVLFHKASGVRRRQVLHPAQVAAGQARNRPSRGE